MTKVDDITGLKFGRLTAIELDHIKPVQRGTRHYWKFLCGSGKVYMINGKAIVL